MAGEAADASSLLFLLSTWSGVNTDKVCLGTPTGHDSEAPQHGYRGLLARTKLAQGETILGPLPWKSHGGGGSVLGLFAATHFVDAEVSKHRGVFFLPQQDGSKWKSRVLHSCQLDALKVWSCTLACALLSALRYPLSPWSPYVASLPSNPTTTQRVQVALRNTHQVLAKRALRRRQAQREQQRAGRAKTHQHPEEKRVNGDDDDAMPSNGAAAAVAADKPKIQNDGEHKGNHNTGQFSCLDHVLLWSDTELQATGDDELVQLVRADWQWLRQVWNDLFCCAATQTPLVSWESWLWAHAMVRSRAVGLPAQAAPPFVFAFDSSANNNEAPTLLPPGVLLPIIDLINHNAVAANAALHMGPKGVAVVATQAIEPGDEVLFDYHPKASLQFFVRNYGFVPSSDGAVVQSFRMGPHWKLQLSMQHAANFGDEPPAMMRLQRVLSNRLSEITLVVSNDQTDDDDEPRDEGSINLLEDGVQSHHRLDIFEFFLGFAIGACRILMHAFGEPVAATTSCATPTPFQYRTATLRLLEQAWHDLKCVHDLLQATASWSGV